MAKRLLKDWTTSEKIDSISLEAEVFFTRLIMKADDYGSYHSNPKLLKAALFPLKDVTFNQIGEWVHECMVAGLIFLYEVEGKEYIRINNFDQRLRNKRNAFPHPVDNSLQVAANSGECRPEVEEKKEEKKEGEPAAAKLFVNVSRGRFEIDSYDNPQKAFEEIRQDERQVESLLRVVRRSGFNSCSEVVLMKAVRHFFTVEGAKPDFTNRLRDELKKHLVNWVRKNAPNLNQYG